jgi:hypothetical protein
MLLVDLTHSVRVIKDRVSEGFSGLQRGVQTAGPLGVRRGKMTLKPDGDAHQFSFVYNKGRALETTNTDSDIDCGQLNKYMYSPGQKGPAKTVRKRPKYMAIKADYTEM